MPQALTDAPEPLSILWYGDGGTGKSTDLCHMAKFGKVWIANLEGGLKAKALASHGIPIENIEVFPGPGEEATYEQILAEWSRIREELNADPKAYAGTGIDSVTEMQQKFAGHVGSEAVRRAASRGMERNPSVMDQDNWREANWYTIDLIRKFKDLPCHFGMTALPRRQQDPDSRVTYVPSVTPSVQEPVIGLPDVICWTEVAEIGGEEEFQGKFSAVGKIRGKDRWRALPKGIVDPTFDRIMQYIDGDLTVDEDLLMIAGKQRRERAAEAEAAATAAAA